MVSRLPPPKMKSAPPRALTEVYGIPVNPIEAVPAVEGITAATVGARNGGRVPKDEIIASQAKQTVASAE